MKTVKNKTGRISLQQTVDELGVIKAQIAELEVRERELRERLVKSGKYEVDGELFRATVATTTVERVDYKEVVGHIPPSPMLATLVRRYTDKSERTTVKVVSR